MGVRSAFFAATYERQMRKTEANGLRDRRAELLGPVTGRVLEIGAGTGLDLEHYGPAVTELVLTEPEPAMVRRLERRVRAAGRPATTVVPAPADALPFEDESFDVVVSALVLCGVPEQAAALDEIRRVLRPGGELRFLEHVRSPDPAIARHQDRMNWLNRLVVCCNCNRPTDAAIADRGFTITEVTRGELPNAPAFVRPMVMGTAVVGAGR
jgi:ubiquinone/menaquinone biosynthesis C-methylase UbiE